MNEDKWCAYVPISECPLIDDLMGGEEEKLPWYRRIFRRSNFSGRRQTHNKYTPHQGQQEMARRRRQIERGIIRP